MRKWSLMSLQQNKHLFLLDTNSVPQPHFKMGEVQITRGAYVPSQVAKAHASKLTSQVNVTKAETRSETNDWDRDAETRLA